MKRDDKLLYLYTREPPAPYGSRQEGHVNAYFTPRGPRITHPKNGCDRFSRFCGTWEQTDGELK